MDKNIYISFDYLVPSYPDKSNKGRGRGAAVCVLRFELKTLCCFNERNCRFYDDSVFNYV